MIASCGSRQEAIAKPLSNSCPALGRRIGNVKVHDQRQLDEEDWGDNIPETVAIKGDLGFQGLQNEFENIHLPHQKPKGKELSAQQRQEHQAFNRQRVKCEHAHAGIKRYRAVTDVYRNRVPDFDDPASTI